jgi:serine/threonine protein phosphatase PrpC
VHGAVSGEILERLLASRNPVTSVAESVVREALANGATDNVTAVVIRRD